MRRFAFPAVILAGFAAGLVLPGASAAPAASPAPLGDCFGHNGVQFGAKDAYLCEAKLGNDPSGGLYWMKSLDNGVAEVNPTGQMVWYKLHPAERNFYVWENYSQPWGGSTPRANGRIIALDEGPAGQCVVVWPDWTVTPTRCFLVRDGGAVVEAPHPMDAAERATVAEYQVNMRAQVPLEYR